MRTSKLATGISAIVIAIALTAQASAAGSGSKAKGAAKATSGSSAKPAGPTKTKTTGASSSAKPGKPKSTTTASTATSSPSTGSTSSTTTPTSPTKTWTPSNPVAQKLSTKPNLLQKAQGVLPANTDLNLATAGFKNFGQFVAAVNVSQNLNINFADLKLKMTGVPLSGAPTGGTGTTTTSSLGQAIHELKPGADATAEAQKAQTQAEIETGEHTTAGVSTTPTTAKTIKSK